VCRLLPCSHSDLFTQDTTKIAGKSVIT